MIWSNIFVRILWCSVVYCTSTPTIRGSQVNITYYRGNESKPFWSKKNSIVQAALDAVVKEDLAQRLREVDIALSKGELKRKKAALVKTILLDTYAKRRAKGHSNDQGSTHKSRKQVLGLGTVNTSTAISFRSLDLDTLERLKAPFASRNREISSEQANEYVNKNIVPERYIRNKKEFMNVKTLDKFNEAMIPPGPEPLPLQGILMYVMSSISLVRERIIAGQLPAWASPLAEVGRYYVIIEDSEDSKQLLRDMNCDKIKRPGKAFSSDLSHIAIKGELNSTVLRGSSVCSTRHHMTVILTSCLNARWGTHGPCCKAEAALMHYQTRFQRNRGAASITRTLPNWVILAEDDHVFDIYGVLRTLAYFNSSLPMTLGHNGRMKRFPLGRMELTNHHKLVEKCLNGEHEGLFDMFPFRNPSIFTIPALDIMRRGIAVGSLRKQCHATGLTHDVIVAMLAWMHRIPHLSHWGHCVLRAPFSSFSHQPLKACVVRAITAFNRSTSSEDGGCLLPSQIAFHDAKKASEQHAAAAYFRFFPATRRGIEACIRKGVNHTLNEEQVNFVRLLHIDGYARTNHSLHPGGSPVDSVTGQWRTFNVADCQNESVLDPLTAAAADPSGRIIGKSGRWLGQIALIDRYIEGTRLGMRTVEPDGTPGMLEVFDKLRTDLLLN